jgi:hypothetical protein
VTAAAQVVAASSPRHNRRGGAISVLATILSGDSLSRYPVSGHLLIELIISGAFLVLVCGAGDVECTYLMLTLFCFDLK